MASPSIGDYSVFVKAGVGLLVVTLAGMSGAHAQIVISDDGVTFPDTTKQTSAVVVPMNCPHGDSIVWDANAQSWVCETDLSLPTPTTTVFVTSSAHTGELGGIDGGDTICQQRAAEVSLSGTWIAWLSGGSDENDARQRLLNSGALGPYTNALGEIVATNLGDLIDGQLTNPIRYNEMGDDILTNQFVWTGTLEDGTRSGDSEEITRCGSPLDSTGWSTQGASGLVGQPNAADSGWTNDTTVSCMTEYRLYCFLTQI